MKESVKDKLRQIRFTILFIKFLLNRGLSLFDTPYTIIKYSVFSGILVELLNKAFGWGISLKATMMITPLLVIVGIVMGWLDVKRFHLLQTENEISTRFNPIIFKMSEKIRKLKKK